MNSKKYWAVIVSAVLLLPLYKIVEACSGGPDPYDYFPSFFQNGVAPSAAAYTPFFYTRYLDYYDSWYDYKSSDALPDANIAEWKTYTGNAVPEADLDSFIYKYDYKDLSGFYNQLEKGTTLQPYSRSDFSQNAFVRWLDKSRDLEALGYLMYAKQCEQYAAVNGAWESPNHDTARMSRLVKNGLQLHKAAKKDFFKWRYAYQAMRMAFYGGRSKQTLELYTTLIGDKTDGGLMYARCLGLKAGALFRTGKKTEAAYFYSRVFDLSDEGKRSAFISYDWANGFANAAVLQMCKTPHERAVVHVLSGLHQYEKALPQMQAAFAADPQVAGLDVLMTREIQKGEERYQEPKLLAARNISPAGWYYERYDTWGENDPETKKKAAETERSYGSYLQQLSSFAEMAAGSDKVSDKAFWHLSSAYIALMKGDAAGTKKYLDIAATGKMSTREHDLHDIINTLYIVKRADHLTPSVENELLPSLKWLDAQAGKSEAFDKTYRDLMGTVLVSAYLRDKDTVRAIYTLARVDRSDRYNYDAYDENGKPGKGRGFFVDVDFQDLPGALLERVSSEGLESAQAFAAGRGKTPYEQWLLAGTPYSSSVLHELEGTKYLRQHQFSKAVDAFRDVSLDDMKKRMLPDPFLFHIEEVHEARTDDSAHLLTKMAFAKQMADLEARANKNNSSATAQFEYAMGLYSMTYYGKASSAFTYYRSTVDDNGYYDSPERRALPAYRRDFYEATTAEAAFVKAAAAATDAGLKAKCLWMAAKCWQKRCPEPKKKSSYEWNSDDYFVNSLGNPYFAQLRQSSTATAFYEDARSSCGYFRDYLKRQK